MHKVIKSQPQNKAINVATIKQYSNIVGDDRDDQLRAQIDAAIDYVQDITGRQLIDAAYDIFYDAIEIRRKIPLSTLNVKSITSVNLYDCSGNATLVDPANYRLSNNFIIFDNLSFNYTNTRKYDAMIIEVQAGYGEKSKDLPDQLVRALANIATYRVTHAGNAGSANLNHIPDGLKTFLRPYMSTNNWIG